jgi:hypothetical protein
LTERASGSSSYQFCDYQSSAWTSFLSGQSIKYARIIIPWDTVETYNPSSNKCVQNQTGSTFNESDGSGTAILSDLVKFIGASYDAGITPMISIGAGNAVGTAGGIQEPYFPNANSAHGFSNTGDLQYFCGFYGIANALESIGIDEPEYEVWNEPDSRQGPNGVAGAVSSNIAANYYVDAYEADRVLLGLHDSLIAGAFNYSSVDNSCCGYMDNYLSAVKSDDSYYNISAPNYFSGHPYNDPAWWATYADFPGTSNLVGAVNNYFSGASVWLTETGVWLNDPTPYNGSTLGAYLNGSPSAQAKAAQGFKNIPSVSSQVKGVNYYEFETYGDGVNEGSDNFDSALLGIAVPEFDQDGLLLNSGGASVPRASFCVLAYGDSYTAATSDSRCDYGSYAGQSVTDSETVLAYCSSAGSSPGSAPSKSGAGLSCQKAGLNTVALSSCQSVNFPNVTLGTPWSNWQGNRQYAYEDCAGHWSYAGTATS